MRKISVSATLMVCSLFLGLPQLAAADSGFIQDMPALAPDPERADAMIWTKPDLDRAAYTKVMIEPVTIFVSPDSEYQGLNADDLKAVSDRFVVALTNTLEPEVPVVNQAGPGTATLRAAITGVKIAKKKRGILGYTPVGLVVTAAQDASGGRIAVDEAVLELEVVDSVSGERLGVMIDKAPKTTEDKLSWESINATFEFYAQRFKDRMRATQ